MVFAFGEIHNSILPKESWELYDVGYKYELAAFERHLATRCHEKFRRGFPEISR